jgi:hypothetical protein
MDMLMSVNAGPGAAPVYEADMISSVQSFNEPFCAQAAVTGIVAHGNAFVFMVCNASDSASVEILGNINPANGPYYGIQEEQNSNQQLINLVSNPSVGTPYDLSIGVGADGDTTLGVRSDSQMLATTTGNNLGAGPLYVLFGQLEGYPYTAGNNEAQWRDVMVATPEPSGLLPLAIGSLGLARRRRRN